MDILTIQLNHVKAKKLLEELEEMNIIEILNSKQPAQQKKPSQLRGGLSKKTATGLLSHVEKSRKEWSNRLESN